MARPKLPLEMPLIGRNDAETMARRTYVAVKEFQGAFDELERAIGMYHLGKLLGWKVLVILHNKRTIRKYEEILRIKVREDFPETGAFAEKSLAYDWAHRYDAFWKVASGERIVPNRRQLRKG